MFLILISWILITIIFLSFGDMLLSACNKISKQSISYSIFDIFWLGLCAVGASVCLISLFLPINSYVLIGFIFIALNYFILKRERFKTLYNISINRLKELPLWAKIAVPTAILVLLLYTSQALVLYDFGLYHEQSMIWTKQFSVVPGLGNLHGRLAFNSNFLLFSTLFFYHPEYYTPFFSLNGLCILVFSIWLITKAAQSQLIIKQLSLLFILVIYILFFKEVISSTSTDILPNLLIIYVLLNLTINKNAIVEYGLPLSIISIFIITLKVSSAPILLIALFFLIIYLRKKEYSNIYILILVGSIIIIPWCARFVILSGYLVYPFPSIDIFSFDWKMPLQAVIDEKNITEAWAKVAYPEWNRDEIINMSVFEWFPIWFDGKKPIYLLLYILATISPITILPALKALIKKPIYLLIWGTSLCGFLFGFFSAPDIRFTVGFVICCGITPFLLFAESYKNKMVSGYNKLKLVSPLLFYFAVTVLAIISYMNITNLQENDTSLVSIIYKPQPISYKDIVSNEVFVENDINGLLIYTPALGQQCFDFCFPCTTRGHLNNGLEMRGVTLSSGFRLEQQLNNDK